MGWAVKKRQTPQERLRQRCHNVAKMHPDFTKASRASIECAFIDAAYFYKYTDETLMSDFVWDTLGTYLATTWSKRSAPFKASVDRQTLRKKPTDLAIHWNTGIGRAAIEFWTGESLYPSAGTPPAPPVKRVLKRLKKVNKVTIAAKPKHLLKLRKPKER